VVGTALGQGQGAGAVDPSNREWLAWVMYFRVQDTGRLMSMWGGASKTVVFDFFVGRTTFEVSLPIEHHACGTSSDVPCLFAPFLE
jgi:hypothetical protein